MRRNAKWADVAARLADAAKHDSAAVEAAQRRLVAAKAEAQLAWQSARQLERELEKLKQELGELREAQKPEGRQRVQQVIRERGTVGQELADLMAKRERKGLPPTLVSKGTGQLSCLLFQMGPPRRCGVCTCSPAWIGLAAPLTTSPTDSPPLRWFQTPKEFRCVLAAHGLVRTDQHVCHIIARTRGGADHPDNYFILGGELGMRALFRAVNHLPPGRPWAPTASPLFPAALPTTSRPLLPLSAQPATTSLLSTTTTTSTAFWWESSTPSCSDSV